MFISYGFDLLLPQKEELWKLDQSQSKILSVFFGALATVGNQRMKAVLKLSM